MSSIDPLTRRRFLHVISAASASACVGCSSNGVDVLTEDLTIQLSDYPKLDQVGQSVMIDAGTLRPIAVTKIDVGDFVVTGTECNHAHCGVSRNGDGWICPCHGSTFSLEGDRLGGPATAGLTMYDWTLDGDTLTILAP